MAVCSFGELSTGYMAIFLEDRWANPTFRCYPNCGNLLLHRDEERIAFSTT
jgi:hypothetical protein